MALIESEAPLGRNAAATSLIDRILGPPSTCKFCDTAPVTTMEKRYTVHPKVAEFWCCATSIFYASGVLVYAAPRSDWADEWMQLNHLPAYVHTCIFFGMITAAASTMYHGTLWEGLGAFDCSMALVLWFASTLTSMGLPLLYQSLILLPLLCTFGFLWRRSTRLAILAAAIIFPISIWTCVLKGWMWGATTIACLCIGVMCFIADRLKVTAPPHLTRTVTCIHQFLCIFLLMNHLLQCSMHPCTPFGIFSVPLLLLLASSQWY